MHRDGINVDRCRPYWKMHVGTFKISNAECRFKATRINKLNTVEKQPFILASAQKCMWKVARFIVFQREFSGRLCVFEMYDFLTFHLNSCFVRRYHQRFSGELSSVLDNCHQHFEPGTDCCSAILGQDKLLCRRY